MYLTLIIIFAFIYILIWIIKTDFFRKSIRDLLKK